MQAAEAESAKTGTPDKPLSKMERVYKDLLFEHATGEADVELS